MIPIILAGAAALLLLGGGQKRRKTKKSDLISSKIKTIKAIPKSGDGNTSIIGEPWSICAPPPNSPKDTHAAISKDGTECMVFWKSNTNDVVRYQIQQELNKLTNEERDSLCNISDCEPDPFAPDPMAYCKEMINKDREEFLKHIITQLWPQIDKGSLPPSDPGSFGEGAPPYFVKFVWDRVSYMFFDNFCASGPVL